MASGFVDVLVQFSRLASEVSSSEAILPLLAGAAIEHVKADGAVVVQVTESGARVAAARGVPAAVEEWSGEPDLIGDELGAELLRAARGSFTRAASLPLVASGGLFGALVLFFAKDRAPSEPRMRVAQGLADLAAVALGRAAHVAQLTHTNAELRASRGALVRTEKLRALGQMAAGLSHDLKNILNPLSLHFQIIQRAIANGDLVQARTSVDEGKSILRRGVETLERLRAFSRQSPDARMMSVDLSALAREATAIARPRMSSGERPLSRIVENLGQPGPVQARPDEIVAATVNLIVNSIDAMPEGGTITVRSGRDDRGAFLEVADDGPGMTPAVQGRVFEPFFTTKGAEGTGLGLAMVFATMQRHGGGVSLDTEPGKGARFTLWFPPAGPAP